MPCHNASVLAFAPRHCERRRYRCVHIVGEAWVRRQRCARAGVGAGGSAAATRASAQQSNDTTMARFRLSSPLLAALLAAVMLGACVART
jgi:hypothetical protein